MESWLYTVIVRFFVVVLLSSELAKVQANRGRIYMVTSPSNVVMPINDDTVLACEMNIAPDKFEWRHFPVPLKEASNPNYSILLSKSHYVEMPPESFNNDKNSSLLTIKYSNTSVAGDYQCLAHYGASVVASIPGRITITALHDFPTPSTTTTTTITVLEGNTVLWHCRPPYSNPPAYIDYYRDGGEASQLVMMRHYNSASSNSANSGSATSSSALLQEYRPQMPRSKALLLPRVEVSDSGRYKCKANNVIQQATKEAPGGLVLRVVRSGEKERPRFVSDLEPVYRVKKGANVFLECAAVGNPIPTVTWRRTNGMLPPTRTFPIPGGLRLYNVTRADDDVYICEHSNPLGTLTHHMTVVYEEGALVVRPPRNTQIKEGEALDLECVVTGTPQPQVSWLLNGQSVLNDTAIEAIGHEIFFRPVEKRHAGIVQCFASNQVGVDSASADLNVIPKQYLSTIEYTTVAGNIHRKHKGHLAKKRPMIPPTKPTVSRLTDESVMIRWSVPKNNGLPISFFKVQYKELSKESKWETANIDIASNIESYEVIGLLPNHWYKFRIAAVYTNNDSKQSAKSNKFYLEPRGFNDKNPLPIPKLTNTETVNSTSIRIYWESPLPNVSVDGYIIHYMSASSAGDYSKATVDGETTTSYVITHLDSDTVYDIKMQSFTTKAGSEFSPIMKSKTTRAETTVAPSVSSTTVKPDTEVSKVEFFLWVGMSVVGLAVLLTLVIFMIICHKWKRKKNANSTGGTDRNDKTAADEINHRIPADANDYVMSPKTIGRSNGNCGLPSNRITITANPLADADNKSQNMIEMACLTSSQNNNSSSLPATSSSSSSSSSTTGGGVTSGADVVTDTVITDVTTAVVRDDKKQRHGNSRANHKPRRKHNSVESPVAMPTENYV